MTSPLRRPLAVVAWLSLATLAAGCEPAKVGGLAEPGANAIQVEITSEPPGASIVVDGTPLGPAPQTVRLNPGPHTVKASKSGYFPQEQKIVLSSPDERPPRVRFTLVASH